MTNRQQNFRSVMLCATLIFFPGLTPLALSEAVITTQGPCAVATTECVTITQTGEYSLRNILLVPPATGTVMVLFNGSGYCQSDSNIRGFVSIDTQIASSNAVLANGTAAGGARHYFTVEPVAGSGPNGYFPLNLNSVRVFPVSTIANRRYWFRMNVTRLDPNISCGFNNLSFSLVFTPS